MATQKVFYSFHFNNDVMRVQQVRNIGVIEDNKPISAQAWEEAGKTSGGIEKWIDNEMKNRSCVVVLVGSETSERPWVQYEIKKAWNDGKGLFGIYIHNLKCPRNGKSSQGKNPFNKFSVGQTNLSSIVKCYNPDPNDAYNSIANNIENWVAAAIQDRK